MAEIFIVPTPVGNLEDITLRALNILKSCDLIFAEDTRTTGILLKKFEIKTRMVAVHQHNEHQKVPVLIDEIIENDWNAAVVSDAGTPGISDPGFFIVREAIAKGVKIVSLPGATAFVPALVASGLPCDKFVFEGFLPHKKGRQTRLKFLAEETRTMVFYESPHRILKSLSEFISYFGAERNVCVAREITKIHESYHRGSLAEVLDELEHGVSKGEMVIILAGKE